MADLDCLLKQHIEKSNNRVFLGLSKTIQNELLDSIYAVCLQLICSEIAETEYVAIEADETTDCATLSQLVFVVRYELRGKVNERFISFVVPKSHDAAGISEAIFKKLEELKLDKTPNKVIAQSYDGTSVMSGKNTGVQARVKAIYKNAHFVHCYAHQLNLIVERCATQSKPVKIFFCNIEAFSSFFSQSTKRTAILDEVVKKRIPRIASTRWNFKSRVVSTVHKYKNDIYECLERILDDNSYDYKTMNKAIGLKHYLDDAEFNYWLSVFNAIMPHCDVLYNELQHRSIDCIKAQKYVSDFKSVILNLRNSPDLDQLSAATNRPSSELGQEQGPTKRARSEDNRINVAKEVCDVILTGVDDRFTFTDHLSIGKLFEPSLFPTHKKAFPENELTLAVKAYDHLNKIELRQELTVIYDRDDLVTAKGSLMLLNFIYENNLTSLLPIGETVTNYLHYTHDNG